MFEAVRRLLSPRQAPASPDSRKQGNAFLAEGRLEDAVRCYRQAVAEAPDDAPACLSLGYGLLEQQQFEEAQHWLARSARLDPRQQDAHFLLGQLARAQGNLPVAIESHARAITCAPEFELAHTERATCLLAMGDARTARALLEECAAGHPAFREARILLAQVCVDAGDAAAACKWLEQALALAPGDVTALTRLAQALVALQRFDEAHARFLAVLAAVPDDPVALVGVANCLLVSQRYDEALAAYDRTLLLHPANAQAHVNRGSALQALGREGEALASFQAALRVRPGYVDALVNTSNLLKAQNRYDEAIALLRQALAQDDGNAAAHWNLALSLLVIGQLEEGWREAEWRWLALGRAPLRTERPQWAGAQDLAGKTLLVYSEQGLGDTLQFCRYVPLAAARGARILLHVQPPLRKLLASLDAPVTFVDDPDKAPDCDYQCPLLSLPLAFGTRIESVPSQVPYLRARSESVQEWKERLGASADLTVGVVWAGNPNHVNDHNRSLPARALAAMALPGVRLVSLQKEVREPERAVLQELLGIRHFGDLLVDFEQTAGLVAAVDLVVTVDTSVAHLAGALGKPMWLLLPFSPDWRYLLDREDCPWYPSARLFRQPRARDWDAVLSAVRHALALWRRRDADD